MTVAVLIAIIHNCKIIKLYVMTINSLLIIKLFRNNNPKYYRCCDYCGIIFISLLQLC